MAINTLKKPTTKALKDINNVDVSEHLEKINDVTQNYDANNPSMLLTAQPRLGVPDSMEVGKVYPVQIDLSKAIVLEWRKAQTVDPNTGENWQYLAGAGTVVWDGKNQHMPVDGWQLMGVCAYVAENEQMPDLFAKVVLQSRKAGNPIKQIELFSSSKCEASARISIDANKFKTGEVEAVGFE